MAPVKKRPAPKSNATKPALDEGYLLVDALSQLTAALTQPKKAKSAPVKQRFPSKKAKSAPVKKQSQHYYIVVGSGSKTEATSTSKTIKPLPKYFEMDSSKRQLIGSTKPSDESLRPAPAKLGAKDAKSIRRDGRDRLSAGSMKSDKKQITEESYHRYEGESGSTTEVNATWDCRRKLYISAATIVALLILAAVAVGVYVAVVMLFYPIETTTSSPLGVSTSHAVGISVSYPSSVLASSPIATSTTHSAPLPFLNETEGLLTYDAICVPHHQGSVGATVPKECVAGFPPNRDSCSGNGTCATYSYRATVNHPYTGWTFKDTTSVATVKYEPGATPAPSKKTTRLLCRTAGDKLGLCDGNSCVNAKVEDDSSWYNHSRWVDNCEKPNPCWYGESIDSFGKLSWITRDNCLWKHASVLCLRAIGGSILFSFKAAVVWLQHLRCDAGANSTTSTVCPGLPFRLWICTMCNATETSYEYYDRTCDTTSRNVTSPCSYRCKQKGTSSERNFYLPNGAECLDSTAERRKYCYGGTCFDTSIKLNEQTRPEALPHRNCSKNKTWSAE